MKKMLLLIIWALGCFAAAAMAVAEPVVAPAGVPVLCYHRFGHYPAQDAYAVTTDEFRRQLELIRAEGFTPITARQLADGWEGKGSLPAKPLVITIDDGYRDFLKGGRPILEEFGYRATLYIYTQFVGSRLGLTPAELAELEAAGYEIGSHSATHPQLTRRPAQETAEARHERLRKELSGSREALQAWCHGPVETLAYPYGLWDEEVAEAGREAGYRLMFTVNSGSNSPDSRRDCLSRSMILHGTREATFLARLREQPLTLAEASPRLGERVSAPLNRISLGLQPEVAAQLVPGSLCAKHGQTSMPLTYDSALGRVELELPVPANRGVQSFSLTAQNAAHDRYAVSWLVIVESAPNKKGL